MEGCDGVYKKGESSHPQQLRVPFRTLRRLLEGSSMVRIHFTMEYSRTLEVVRGGKTDEMKNPPVGITDEVRSDERGTNWDKGKRLANYIPLTRYNGDRTDETGSWINNAVSDFPSTSGGGGGFESSSPEFFLSHIDIALSFRNTMDMYT